MSSERFPASPYLARLIGWFWIATGSVLALASTATLLLVRRVPIADAFPGSEPAAAGLPGLLSHLLLGNIHGVALALAIIGAATVIAAVFFYRGAYWARRAITAVCWLYLFLLALALFALVGSGIAMIAMLHDAASSTPIYVGVMLIVAGLGFGALCGMPIMVMLRRMKSLASGV